MLNLYDMENYKSHSNINYMKIEALGGLVLLVAAILGCLLSNSPFAKSYYDFVNFPISFSVINYSYSRPTIFWINEGLIAIFFFLIGLEIKYMVKTQSKEEHSQLTAPIAGAILGAIVPALIFTLFNYSDQIAMRGWAIPTAMDTAFILGVLALLGTSISSGLKFFVMTLSIIDDIIAVLIIAFFYAEDLSNISIIGSTIVFGILVLLNQMQVKRGAVYLFFGFLLWLLVLGSGVHTSIAGVLIALTIPMDNINTKHCLLRKVKGLLHPIASFFILPLFAFANTGIDLSKLSIAILLHPLSLGIICGLFIGKQLGIFGITYTLVAKKIVKLPENTSMLQMYGVSVLCGLGFTMSLFIGFLAFESGGPAYNEVVKASVFIGSLLSAVVAYIILFFHKKSRHNR